ncbi:Formation of crista junctions protein 1 [Physocladia obscura]|uniref:MICOS complex subunit MIC60 n=1 Tax=Physocladia obscura TaxID=109957 RepID=A0AAD5T4X2_9FUNG|nr:Formation of crista junctions protein 1 [Physocladia obscura]
MMLRARLRQTVSVRTPNTLTRQARQSGTSSSSSSSDTKKKFGVLRATLLATGIVGVAGSVFVGAAVFADSNPQAKKLWIDNTEWTGGQGSIDTATGFVAKVRAFDPKQLQDQANAKFAEASLFVNNSTKTVSDAYNSAATSVANVSKSISDTANSVFETVESVKSSIFGSSSSTKPPSLPPPPPSVSVAIPAISSKKEEKKLTQEKSAAKSETKPEPVKQDREEDIYAVPIDFTPLDDHTVLATAPTPTPTPVSEKKKKSSKKEKEPSSTTVDAAAAVATTTAVAQISAITTQSRAILPANVSAHLESLARAIDSIKPSSKNASILADARTALANLARESVKIGAGDSTDINSAEFDAKLREALEIQADGFIKQLGQQNQAALDALSEQEKELAETFEAALKLRSAALAEERDAAIREHDQQKAREFAEKLDLAVKAESAAIEAQWNKHTRELVDKERDGRLAKLDYLALKLKYLETAVVGSSDYIERMQSVQQILAALQLVTAKFVEGGSFKKEFRLLKKYGEDDELVSTVLSAINEDVAVDGVVSLDELKYDFNSLETKLRRVQLMPDGGGPIAYTVSYALSFLLIPKTGLVAGNDTESVLARSRFYLASGDLESATREVNQLNGWSRVLAQDWLKQARTHLEVKQALETIESHIALKNLGAI